MKNNSIYLTLFSAALLLGGCTRDLQEERLPGSATGESVLFSAQGSASTRTDVTTDVEGNLVITWKDTDMVGIYGTSDGRATGNNFAYTATPLKSDASRCTFSANDTQSGMFKWIMA